MDITAQQIHLIVHNNNKIVKYFTAIGPLSITVYLYAFTYETYHQRKKAFPTMTERFCCGPAVYQWQPAFIWPESPLTQETNLYWRPTLFHVFIQSMHKSTCLLPGEFIFLSVHCDKSAVCLIMLANFSQQSDKMIHVKCWQDFLYGFAGKESSGKRYSRQMFAFPTYLYWVLKMYLITFLFKLFLINCVKIHDFSFYAYSNWVKHQYN